MSLDRLLSFVTLTHQFQQVRRQMYVTGEDRYENDLEHSGQLALVCWYVAQSQKLNLDTDKLVKYAMIHDLVEAYAGDTYIFADADHLATKAAREEDAMHTLQQNFPEFGDLHELLHEYELRQTPESIFVYAMDKLLPVFNIYLDGGKTWKMKDAVTLERMLGQKSDKIALSPEVDHYYQQLVEILRGSESEYFDAYA